MSNIHIGDLILKKVEERGLNKAKFAKAIDKMPQNINDVFDKQSIDTELLSKISKVLEHDFFQYYTTPENLPIVEVQQQQSAKPPFEVSLTIKINDKEKEEEVLKLVLGEAFLNLLKDRK